MYIMFKKEGELLSELVLRARSEHSVPENISITYAGRLDPMASGVMALLVGTEEIKTKNEFLTLPKTYEFEILFGVSTDTHDVLGMVNAVHVEEHMLHVEKVKEICIKYSNKTYTQKYPAYSSKPVNGTPLFELSKKGIQVELPEHSVTLYSLEHFEINTYTGAQVADNAITRIQKVSGDFRQSESIQKWTEFKNEHADEKFECVRMCASVSSGTYIRVLACDIARELGTIACAYSIVRTKVGEYTVAV